MIEDAMTLQRVSHMFGGFTVLDAVELAFPLGGRTALIGPNGAGKTTLFNVLDGTIRPTHGRVLLGGDDVTQLGTTRRARLRIARTYQVTNLLSRLTVAENIGLAIAGLRRYHRTMFWRPMLQQHDIASAASLLMEEWNLSEVAETPVMSLAYGQQRILEIVLGLARKPLVLLLDEPTAGLSQDDAHNVAEVVGALPRSITVVMIEHDMDVAFRIADEICVLHHGSLLARGTPAAIGQDQTVIDAYFGEQLSVEN